MTQKKEESKFSSDYGFFLGSLAGIFVIVFFQGLVDSVFCFWVNASAVHDFYNGFGAGLITGFLGLLLFFGAICLYCYIKKEDGK